MKKKGKMPVILSSIIANYVNKEWHDLHYATLHVYSSHEV